MTNPIKDTIISTISTTISNSDIIINYNKGICIDTSNNRIGFDISDPLYTIDISISNAIINFKDEIRLKGTNSFLVSPIKAIEPSTIISYNMLTSISSSDKDFSSIETAPIIYKQNALYPSELNINLGTLQFEWNNIYCKDIISETIIIHNIDCSTIFCSSDISCSNNIYSHQYELPNIDYIQDIKNLVDCNSQINAINFNNINSKFKASIAFVDTEDHGVCTLFGSNLENNSIIKSTDVAMIITGTSNNPLKNKNVGIGTINPTEKLEVDGNIFTSGTIKANSGLIVTLDISCINSNIFVNSYINANIITANNLNINGNNIITIEGETNINSSLTVNKNLTINSDVNCQYIIVSYPITIGGDLSFNGSIFKSWDISVNNDVNFNNNNNINFNKIDTAEIIVHSNIINVSNIKVNSINGHQNNNKIIIDSKLKLSNIQWLKNNENQDYDFQSKSNFGFFLGGAGLIQLRPNTCEVQYQFFPNMGRFVNGSQYAPMGSWQSFSGDWSMFDISNAPMVRPETNTVTFLVINTTDNGDINNNVYKFASRSDKKLKTNIQPFRRMLDLVNKLNPVYFTWIDSSYIDYGFIAQELEKIIPGIITYKKDDDGEIIRVYSINTPIYFISVLTKAIQDLAEDKDKEISELKVKNRELKDENIIFKLKIATLKNKVTILKEEKNTINIQLDNILKRLSILEN